MGKPELDVCFVHQHPLEMLDHASRAVEAGAAMYKDRLRWPDERRPALAELRRIERLLLPVGRRDVCHIEALRPIA